MLAQEKHMNSSIRNVHDTTMISRPKNQDESEAVRSGQPLELSVLDRL